MAGESLIQWPRATYWDKAWNPVIGCKPCSPACANCYAAAWAKRFGQSFEPHFSAQARPPRKGVVFCGNMTDLFGGWCDGVIPPEFHIRQAIGKTHNDATYLWLTKRVGRMCDAVKNSFNTEWKKTRRYCHYFGFTAENQEWFNIRVDAAAEIPLAFNQWLSAEPLLGPIDMGDMVEMFKWVVVGCESGPNRRPCKLEWVERIVEQCRIAGVPVFVKQICLPNGTFTNKIEEFPEHLRIRQVPWTIVEEK